MRTTLENKLPLLKGVQSNLAARQQAGHEHDRVVAMLQDAMDREPVLLGEGDITKPRVVAELNNIASLKRICPLKAAQLLEYCERLRQEGAPQGRALGAAIGEFLGELHEGVLNKVRARLAGFIPDADLEDAVAAVVSRLSLAGEIRAQMHECAYVDSAEGSIGYWETAEALAARVENFGK